MIAPLKVVCIQRLEYAQCGAGVVVNDRDGISDRRAVADKYSSIYAAANVGGVNGYQAGAGAQPIGRSHDTNDAFSDHSTAGVGAGTVQRQRATTHAKR